MKASQPEIYSSIDDPIYVWRKVHETSDLSWLLVKKKRLNKKLTELLTKAWEKIYAEFIDEFGFSEEFLSIKNKEIEIAELKVNFILNNDRTQLTLIQLAERELKEMGRINGKVNFMQSVMAVEKKFHFQIDEHKTSIRKFYTYLKDLK